MGGKQNHKKKKRNKPNKNASGRGPSLPTPHPESINTASRLFRVFINLCTVLGLAGALLGGIAIRILGIIVLILCLPYVAWELKPWFNPFVVRRRLMSLLFFISCGALVGGASGYGLWVYYLKTPPPMPANATKGLTASEIADELAKRLPQPNEKSTPTGKAKPLIQEAGRRPAVVRTDHAKDIKITGIRGYGEIDGVVATHSSKIDIRDAVVTRNTYEKMTNAQLTEEAMALAAKIKRLRGEYDAQSRDLSTERAMNNRADTPPEERERLWQYYNKRSADLGEKLKYDYYSRYRTDAKLIREAMLDRVASTLHDRNADGSYEDTGYWQMLKVADDLETLAKTLNPKASAHP